MPRCVPLLPLLLLAACGERAAPPAQTERPDSTVLYAFRDVPFMFGAKIGGTTHSGNTAETQLVMDVSPDSVANYYRVGLLRRGWNIASDVRAADGSITIYARSRDQRPVWLMIRPNPAGSGTIMSVVGTAPGTDSAAAR